MATRKHAPERKSRSGSYVPDELRGAHGGATERVVVRCSPELAARARAVAKEHGRTLADVLEAGVESTMEAYRRERDEREEMRAEARGEEPRANWDD